MVDGGQTNRQPEHSRKAMGLLVTCENALALPLRLPPGSGYPRLRPNHTTTETHPPYKDAQKRRMCDTARHQPASPPFALLTELNKELRWTVASS